MRVLHERLLEHLEKIDDRIHQIKPPMPGFMYDDIRNTLPENNHHLLKVLQSHLTEQIDSIQSALDKIHRINEAYRQLSEIAERSLESVQNIIHQNNSRNQAILSHILDLVDELSLNEEDKLRIKDRFHRMEIKSERVKSQIDSYLRSNHLQADSIARNAISD